MKRLNNNIAIIIGLSFLIFCSGCTNYDEKGFSEYEKGNYQAAVEDLKKAIERNPNDDMAYDWLSMVYRDFNDAPNHRDNAYEFANQAISVCPKDSPNLAEHYLTLADLYRTDRNYKEANINFKKSLELDANNYETQFFYGVSLYAVGDIEAGIGHIKKSLKIKPDYQNAKNFLDQIPRY